MSITPQQAFDGKSAEHIVITELLLRGIVPFVPILDRGIDIVIENKSGDWRKIQVKSNNSPILKNQKWFVFPGELVVEPTLFYVLVQIQTKDIWIVPSAKVKEYGQQCKTQFDLQLQQKSRSLGQIRELLLQDYKENWSLLID